MPDRIVTFCRVLLCAGLLTLFAGAAPAQPAQSVARQWNEVLLEAIRKDFARPTVHARNLWHVSIAIWDAWAVFDEDASTYLLNEKIPVNPFQVDVTALRNEAISIACYRILKSRFAESPGKAVTIPLIEAKMAELGFDPAYFGTVGESAAAVGNRIAATVLYYGLTDGANEQQAYAINNGYLPVNLPMVVDLPTTMPVGNPNRWQPLALDFFVDQAGNPLPISVQTFLGPHWGQLPPFAMTPDDLAPGKTFVYHDPSLPPQFGGVGDAEYKAMFVDNAVKQSGMSPDFAEMIDISPAALGNNPLGTNDGQGYPLNPVTNQPYTPQFVKLGDWARCIAEFWADGPDSETPPGHWNTLGNYVTDNLTEKRIGGVGPIVDDLEWDVKMYLALNGAVYDAAVCAWGIKGYYDYVRPITAIRYMSLLGQSSDPTSPSYHPGGMLLVPGVIEVITAESSAPGQRHAALSDHVGEIAILGWPGEPENPETEYSGVVWQLGIQWLPYQRETFVTPPFAGYISGHSTFSRSAAEVLTSLTGSPYFPNGLGEFFCPRNEFLVFEDGPSADLTLQWASFYDAADEAGISRLWGGIHPRADDFPGRINGATIGLAAWERAQLYYAGTIDTLLLRTVIRNYLLGIFPLTPEQLDLCDQNGDGEVDVSDLLHTF